MKAELTLKQIRRNAKKDPGACAVCGRKLKPSPAGGKPGIICSQRVRPGCKKAYQAAYRAEHRGGPRLYAIKSIGPHPTEPGLRRVKLSCGHTRDLPTGDANSGRRKSHCPKCSPMDEDGLERRGSEA